MSLVGGGRLEVEVVVVVLMGSGSGGGCGSPEKKRFASAFNLR